MNRNPLVRLMFSGGPAGLLGTVDGVDAEEMESLLLESCGPGMQDELVLGTERGDHGVLCQRCQVGEQRLETVNGQTLGGSPVSLFGEGRRRALGLGDDAGAPRFGDIFVGIVVE